MLLKMSALPVPGPRASRMMVPSSMFQSTSASISASSPCALSALIQPRKSPKETGLRSAAISSVRAWNITDADLTVVPAKAGTHDHRLWNMGPRLRGDDSQQYDANNMMPSQSGGFGVTPLAWRVMIELEPFICERQLLDGNVIARGIEVGRLEFDRQRPLEHPSDR